MIQASRVTEDAAEGDSIAVNGACLTVTSLRPSTFSVGVMAETVRRTNLGDLVAGDLVNLEADVLAKYVEKLVLH